MNTGKTKRLKFRPLSIKDKEVYDKYASALNECYGGEYNFAAIWLESVVGQTEIAEYNNMVFVKTKYSSNWIFYPPLLEKADMLPEAVKLLEEETDENTPLEIWGVAKEQASLLDTQRYSVADEREYEDYLYLPEDLIHLSGKKFHSKRNFINRFESTYKDVEKRAYDESADRAAILALHKKWNEATQHEKWEFEEKAVERALDDRYYINYKIAVLYVEKNLVAFSIAHVVNSKIGITFFEKADINYVGAYQVINQFVAETFFKDVKYINRQYDMGIEGLRKAKESYHPVMTVEKYRIKSKS